MGRRYAALISYAAAAEEPAAWLEAALNAYRPPENLAPDRSLGAIVRRQRTPGAARELDAESRAALDEAEFLIDLRPPREPASEEVHYFRGRGGGLRIITALVEGETNPAAESFVWRRLEEAGSAQPQQNADDRHAADLRGGKAEREAAKRAIVASLLGTTPDGLTEMERAARRDRADAEQAAREARAKEKRAANRARAEAKKQADRARAEAKQMASAARAETNQAAAAARAEAKQAADAARAEARQASDLARAEAKRAADAARADRVNKTAALAGAVAARMGGAASATRALAARHGDKAVKFGGIAAASAAVIVVSALGVNWVVANWPQSAPAVVAQTEPPQQQTALLGAASEAEPPQQPQIEPASPPPPLATAEAPPAIEPPAPQIPQPQIQLPQTAPPQLAASPPPVEMPPEPAVVAVAQTPPAPEMDPAEREALIRQLRQLGEAQGTTVRCHGRRNQTARDRALALIESSPRRGRMELGAAFNDAYTAAEASTAPCPAAAS